MLLIQHQQPNRSQWQNLFRIVDYEFRFSWHYQTILAVAGLLSIVTILQLGIVIYAEPENIFVWIVSSQITLLTFVFWSTLWLGTDTSLDPVLFREFGPYGLLSFFQQLVRLLRQGTIWSGIEPLYKSVVNEKITLIATTVAFVSTLADSSAANIILSTALFVCAAVTVSSIGVDSNSVNGGIALIAVMSLTTLIVNDFITIFAANPIAIATTGMIAVAITGLGSWRMLESNPKRRYLCFLAVFAFPWFCWFPTAVSTSILALHNLLIQISPFSLPIWQQTTVVTLAITALSAALWWRGQYLDARARNPFQSGPIGAALGVKR